MNPSATYHPAPHLAESLDVLAPNLAATTPGDTVSRHRGDLYATDGAWRSAAEIARAVRADIKVANAAGDLPGKAAGLVYAVRSSRFSMGQEVTVTLRHAEDDRHRPTGAWSRRPAREGERSYYQDGQVVRDDVRALAEVLARMVRRYTRTDSDAGSDLHNTSCYVTVTVAGGGDVA